jgi:DpnII restriction endonuclease/AAA domain-containing protein
MEAQNATLEEAIAAFRKSLVEDVYAAQDFIPWQQISEQVEDAAPGIRCLNEIARSTGEGIDMDALADALLDEPKTFSVVQRLLSVPAAGVGFADGRQLPENPPRDEKAAAELSRLLLDVGLDRLITEKAATEELLRVALIAGDTRRRSNRRRRSLEDRLASLLKKATTEASAALEQPVHAREPTDMPLSVRNRLRRVLYGEDGRPLAAVATMFETTGGGRQGETFRGFGRVQDELDLVPVSLILIADGRGIREIPVRSVEEVWDRIGSVLSLKQVEEGMLAKAVIELVENPAAPSLARLPLAALIGGALDRGVRVDADDLPVNEEVARLAIARFDAENETLGLDVDSEGRSLTFTRADEVAGADLLAETFEPESAISLVASLVARRSSESEQLDSGQRIAVLGVPSSPLIPGELVVAAQGDSPDAADVRVVAGAARERALKTTMAILVVPDAEAWLEDSERELVMRTTATSVVVVDPADLRKLAVAADPQDALSVLILQQADLTKTSPFIHNGVTPPQLFAGRREEETRIVSDLATSSVAVLGSRQIGKTSLLRRVEQTLRAQGRAVYYGDCQAIGEWGGFRALAKRNWNVELAEVFEPDQVAAMVERLAVGDDPPVVILDEIDRLVAWDLTHDVGGVTEAFFRGLRTQSQAGSAQFVFSGERTIAEVLWSPASPHWNFCQRLSLRQLDREAAAGLLFDVLSSLSVRFENKTVAEQELWRATSGHPRLVQLLGDQLVRRLNERPGGERDRLSESDLQGVIDTFDFKSEYVDTYWGQATPFEKELTRSVAEGERSLEALQERIAEQNEPLALRILELYGIIDIVSEKVQLRAEFLPKALSAAGPALKGT